MQTVKVKPLVRAEDCRYKYAITRVINPAGERYMLTMNTSYGCESLPGRVHGNVHVMINRGLGNDINLHWMPYEGAINSYGVAIENPYVVDDDASLYSGWIVTLGKGVTATANGVKCDEGDKLAVYGGAAISTLKSEGTAIIAAPANNGVLVKNASTISNTDPINSAMTLVAASKVTAGDNVTIKFLGDATAEQTITKADSDVYVVVETELTATTDNNKEIVVSGADKIPGTGSVSFVVGDKDITVTAP